MKVMTIVGTRPELIKLSRVIYELDQCVQHLLVHTGQNYDYELNEVFFIELGIRRPDHFLNVTGMNLGETLGNIIASAYRVLTQEQPDALLLLGDTNSCLSAIPAKRLKIPIFHMEAGNRSFDERIPEEVNRRIVDHTSDINLPYSEHARRYLIAEGIRAETVIKTGSPMREVLDHYMPNILASKVLEQLGLKADQYFLVSIHREENVDDTERLGKLVAILDMLASQHGFPVIVSTHPRTMKHLQRSGIAASDERVRFLKPMGFFDYVQLQMSTYCVLSDSGTITEESSILNFPAIMLREAHERPEGMDEGTLIMCGLDATRVTEAVAVVKRHFCKDRVFRIARDYRPQNVSKKVVRTILSYVNYVNRVVWHQ
jgi:UDP-N-acetylglucosamine 2-epimerase (non-hydrolysing)